MSPPRAGGEVNVYSDAFAGAGMNWLWKDYLLWHLAGVSAFYNEQGVDLYTPVAVQLDLPVEEAVLAT